MRACQNWEGLGSGPHLFWESGAPRACAQSGSPGQDKLGLENTPFNVQTSTPSPHLNPHSQLTASSNTVEKGTCTM